MTQEIKDKINELDEELKLIEGSLDHNVEPNNLISNFWRKVDKFVEEYNLDKEVVEEYLMALPEERIEF